jgi:outer membrane receptor protein involved in Fe transport
VSKKKFVSRKKLFAPAVLSGLACLAAAPSHAQQAAAAPSDAASAPAKAVTLDQVVVTSQKRREDIRKVPLSVSVISGDAMQANQINDVQDISRSIPNVSFTNAGGGSGLSTLQIRGISSQAGSATVAVYLDDVSLTTRNLYSQGTAEPRFFDIERVEVLRGPQGTLYGASSLGGTIRFISKQPDAKQFGGSAAATVSSTAHGGTNHEVQGVLNVPLVKDSVALRLGVQSGHSSGFVDQVDPATLQVIDKGINSQDWNVLKGAVKFKLNDAWTITPSIFAQRYKSNDIDATYLAVGDYQPVNKNVPLQIFQTSKIVREPGKDSLTVPTLTVNGDVGIGDLTGILSGYKRRFDRVQDGTSINSVYIGSVVTDTALGAIVGALPSAVQLQNKIDQTSVELRLQSKDYDASRSPFTWVAGFYSAKTKTEVFDNEPVFGINAAFAAAGKDINDPAELVDTFPGAFAGDSSYYSARHYNDKQNSAFGELSYHVNPELTGTFGLRVLKASQHFTREGDFYYAGGPSSAVIDSSFNAVTPRFAVNWDMDPGTSLFANVAKGFRLGGANRPIPPSALVLQDIKDIGLSGSPPASFEPDTIWSYEVGSKSRLLDNRLSLNVSAFYTKWKNIQQDVTLPASGYDFETNVGRATTYGLEFEAKLRASDSLTLDAALGLVHATFAEDTPALGTDPDTGELHVRKGDRIQGAPNYNLAIGFEYRFRPMTQGDAFIRASGKWTGASRGSLIKGDPDYDRPAYFTADASVGMTFDHWELTLFGKNLTNVKKQIQHPSVQGVSEAYYLRPRTLGVTASYEFF